MSPFLDPRSDLVFRKIFGEHPLILMNFLNALLPIESPIESVEYLSIEAMPILPVFKRGIVDVRCRDQAGRQFIVEMQMQWTSAFLHRVVFNASQAYVKQLEAGEAFDLLQPVIALSILDDIFIRDSQEYYHHYRIVDVAEPKRRIDGLEFVFVELPKFRATQPADSRRLRWAWLRFLREAADVGGPGKMQAETFEKETAINSEIQQAFTISRESNFTIEERAAYDRFWDAVRSERTLLLGKTREAHAVGKAEGKAEGLEEGIAVGKAEGIAEGIEMALLKMISAGMPESEARRILGLD
jgi:predicted transposase/invertase (TIGR01784 family)